MLTKEQEIAALQYAREQVEQGFPYICNHVIHWAYTQDICDFPVGRQLPVVMEIMEFLDGTPTVDGWLHVYYRYGVVKQYRLAIIDTLLARRGVFN